MNKFREWVDRHLSVGSTAGDEVVALCVFHDDSSPSMYVNTRKGVFYCHSCHASGSIEKIARQLDCALTSETNIDAVMTDIANLKKTPKDEEFYPEGWLEQFDWRNPHRYWTDVRKFDSDICLSFKLGYDAKYHAGTIPLRNVDGKIQGVIRRRLDSDAKPRYMYPKNFKLSDNLWGSWRLRMIEDDLEQIVITEGSLDTIALWQAHIPSVALLGSSISKHQVKVLRYFGIKSVVAFTDNDEAGHRAADNINRMLSGITVTPVKYLREWRAKDPAGLTLKQRREAVRNAIQ